jgi:hypothetical protein
MCFVAIIENKIILCAVFFVAGVIVLFYSWKKIAATCSSLLLHVFHFHLTRFIFDIFNSVGFVSCL